MLHDHNTLHRTPQAQKAVNRLLDGGQGASQDEHAAMAQKRSKPPPLQHFTDSHVIVNPNGLGRFFCCL